MESVQRVIKHRLEWESKTNELEIIIVDLPAPCTQASAPLGIQIQEIKLF